jgi:hypothetical protein
LVESLRALPAGDVPQDIHTSPRSDENPSVVSGEPDRSVAAPDWPLATWLVRS